MILSTILTRPLADTLSFSNSSAFAKALICILILASGFWTERAFAQGVSPGVVEEIEGQLQILYEDSDAGSRLLFGLKTASERLSLQFAGEAPTHLLTGAKVRVRGVRFGNLLALGGGNGKKKGNIDEVTPPPPLSIIGERRVLMILVNFQDKPDQPYSVAEAENILFGTTGDFVMENSYQQTWLSGDVAGWYTIPLSSTGCDYVSIASFAQAAASAAGYDLSAYHHYVYAFPQNGCGGFGFGTVGGNPSETWINGSLDLKVLSHELGHSFGLYHAHALDCGTSVLGTNCSVLEYGDRIDTMGNVSAGHFNAFQKQRLGWLGDGTSPPITTVQGDGLYTIEPLEAAGSGTKALVILKSTDPETSQQTWYYLEYRRALGFDSFLATNNNVLNGIMVHTGSPPNGDSSYLLDMTPASAPQNWSDWSDPALEVGESFHDPNSGMTLTTVSATGTGAIVSVNFAAPICSHADPSVTIAPSQSPIVQAGTAVTYAVSVTNHDPSSCAESSFALQATVPSGWNAALASSTLTLNPGMTSSTTLTVTSPPTASRGTYTFTVSASNTAAATSAASTEANYVIKRK